ncbi:hypothetical protein [Sphingopyxis sp. R3-92]|uniref:hypothetical protein n=1 Tax=Sphingopyxis sp. R3-92 TaxID=3158553 RepID=UPI003EE51FF5
MAIVDKMTAAERLIQNAIEMIDRKDDPLAIHVVASSALSLLRELVGTGGDDYVAQLLKDSVLRAAQAKLQGLPTGMPEAESVDEIVDSVVRGIEAGVVKSTADIVIVTPKKEVRAYLDYIFKPYNFLKHADQDPLATMDEGDFDPEGALAHAMTAYLMARSDGKLPEPFTVFLKKQGILV